MDALNQEWDMPPAEREPDYPMAFSLAVLALVAALSTLVIITAAFFRSQGGKSILRDQLCQIVGLGSPLLCAIPVGMCKIRRPYVAGCTVFLSSVCVWIVVGYLLSNTDPYRGVFDKLLESDWVLAAGISLAVLSVAFIQAVVAARRAIFPFSEKSGRWLLMYSVTHGFTFDDMEHSFEGLTFDDIIMTDRIPLKWSKKGVCELFLHLDRIPDGDHRLKVVLRRKVRFFSLSFSGNLIKRKTLAITRSQAEEIAEKFGPIKKTFFLCG